MISLSEILHTIAQALMIPCLIILLVLMAGAVWQIGDIVVEFIAERRKHKCDVPQLLRDVHTAGADGLAELIENSGLLRRQKKALLELAESRGLPKDTLTALAERKEKKRQKQIEKNLRQGQLAHEKAVKRRAQRAAAEAEKAAADNGTTPCQAETV